MLSIPGLSGSTCDGYSRRELLEVGALSLFGSLLAPPMSSLRARCP